MRAVFTLGGGDSNGLLFFVAARRRAARPFPYRREQSPRSRHRYSKILPEGRRRPITTCRFDPNATFCFMLSPTSSTTQLRSRSKDAGSNLVLGLSMAEPSAGDGLRVSEAQRELIVSGFIGWTEAGTLGDGARAQPRSHRQSPLITLEHLARPRVCRRDPASVGRALIGVELTKNSIFHGHNQITRRHTHSRRHRCKGLQRNSSNRTVPQVGHHSCGWLVQSILRCAGRSQVGRIVGRHASLMTNSDTP